MNIPEYLVIHHTTVDSYQNQYSTVNEYHKSLGFPISRLGQYCGYHKFIERNGAIITARHDDERGAHTIGSNERSIGVCLAGNFDISFPTQAQIKAVQELEVIYLLPVKWHREVQENRTCPGKNLIAHSIFAAPTIEVKPLVFIEETKKHEEIIKQLSWAREVIAKLTLAISLLLKR